jgi:arylsulfatase A
LAVVVSLGAASWSASVAAEPRPNFIVVLCDDLGYGDLRCFGHPVIETPHLDRMAHKGIRLTSCYSATLACSPSRVGLLTGRIPASGRRLRLDSRCQSIGRAVHASRLRCTLICR